MTSKLIDYRDYDKEDEEPDSMPKKSRLREKK